MPKKPTAELVTLAQEMTSKQKALVDNLLSQDMTQKEAAILAGYAEGSAHVSASRVLRLPHVQAYIEEAAKQAIRGHSLNAIGVVARLSTTAKSDFVKLSAAQDILDRSGLKAPEKHMHAIKGELVVNIDLG